MGSEEPTIDREAEIQARQKAEKEKQDKRAKFQDQNGNVYSTPEARDAANAAILENRGVTS